MAAYRAPSLLQPHRAREALADAHAGRIPPLMGFFCGLASPPVAKLVAQCGWDVIWVDWEHSAMNVETMTQMLHDIQFHSEGKTMAFVRLPGTDHAAIGYALDAGASIMVPQVETVEQAREIVAAAKYGAKIGGSRSAPPARLMPGLSDMPMFPNMTLHQSLNMQAAVAIQIESLEGIRNLDAILTAVGEHIDSVWLGSLDARISMDLGAGGLLGGEPEWLEAVALYESTLAKHNKPASGLALGTPEMKAILGRGRSFMVTGCDFYGLLGQSAEMTNMRQMFPQVDHSKVYKKL
ncbi:2-keto-3-deoxy-L-rhamnonate aldolase [Hyphodiscus hymeniophilus]|uniref:2-keto-3-deoxy-L-rhamnonate aldolase n=1 Tax=Hyphodiscus hymeniophilus TaxID=353542 RepID=A0A9P7AV69_9HELO|nr:2-keto-3-deoxy-L-rhamnonate aldolase [Hyphodiscus hymeniophilus]